MTTVKRGIVFPQGSIPGDPDSVRAYTDRITQLGYDHLVVPDHVLGVQPELHPGWSGVYDIDDAFHEPLVLFGFLSAVTTLELVTGLIVLPQRQAALVAKQAAEIDLLSRGRLRLGVGIGWNAPEFEGLGMEFRSRGRRIDEQITLMRRLWTERSVTFAGADHTLNGVGIAPMPVQRPIPVWIGAETARKAFERVGRLGDGWMAMGGPTSAAREAMQVIRRSAEGAGRDPDGIGVQAWVNFGDGSPNRITEDIAGWLSIGATHIAMNTRTGEVQNLEENMQLAEKAMIAFERAVA
jgi:probable F420-dependent oxidoreductase